MAPRARICKYAVSITPGDGTGTAYGAGGYVPPLTFSLKVAVGGVLSVKYKNGSTYNVTLSDGSSIDVSEAAYVLSAGTTATGITALTDSEGL